MARYQENRRGAQGRSSLFLTILMDHSQQYFGGFFKNELFFKDPEGVNSRRARSSARCPYWLCSKERA